MRNNIIIKAIIFGCLLFQVACDSSVYKSAQEKDTVEAYQNYIAQYPQGKFRENALSRLDELSFQEAKRKDSWEAYQYYLGKYPHGKHTSVASNRLEELAFLEAKQKLTIDAYQKYLDKFPTQNIARVQETTAEIDRLSYEIAKALDTVDSYQAYKIKFPTGRFASEATANIIKLKIKDVVGTDDIQAHQNFLENYHIQESDSVRHHLLELVKKNYGKANDKNEQDLLEKIFNKYCRDIFIGVKVKSWRSQPNDYLSELTANLSFSRESEINSFNLVDNALSAQILVNLEIDEKKAGKYYKDWRGIGFAGYGTNVSANLSVTNMLSHQKIISRTINYKQPESVYIETGIGFDSNYEEKLSDKAKSAFMSHFFLKNLGQVISILLGDTTSCQSFYEYYMNDKENRILIKEFLETSNCQPKTNKELITWYIATRNRQACLSQGQECVKSVCEILDHFLSDINKYFEYFSWIKESGLTGIDCLCNMIGIKMNDPQESDFYAYHFWKKIKNVDQFTEDSYPLRIKFYDILNAITQIGGEQATRCLQKQVEIPPREFTMYTEEVINGKIRQREQKNFEAEKLFIKNKNAIQEAINRLKGK